MDIVTTREELAEAVGTSTFGYTSFARKDSVGELHPGHEQMVNYSNANFDKTVVGFWHGEELLYAMFGHDYFEDSIGKPWDEAGCLAWCESKGVDVVLVTEVGYSQTWLNQIGIPDGYADPTLKAWIDQVWADNNYPYYPTTPIDCSANSNTLRAQMVVACQHYKNKLNQTAVASWKDGFFMLIMKDYITKYTTEDYALLDPIKSPEGVYYSSNYSNWTAAEKDIINQIENVVNQHGYDNEYALADYIKALAPGQMLIRRIETTIGGVAGASNDFINIHFTLNGKLDNHPIYKKGVR